jgi:hypothetical protein
MTTTEEKLEIFDKYLNKIENEIIKQFTEFCILEFPEYFWTLPASTSGKYHGKNETLINHVLSCCEIGLQICEGQFKDHWTQKQKDQLISALILHDGWRCGEPGNELKKNGKLATAPDHAEIGYKQLLKLVIKFNQGENKIGSQYYKMILRAIRYHYGIFLKLDPPFSLSWPYDSIVVQVHNIDIHDSISKRIKCV